MKITPLFLAAISAISCFAQDPAGEPSLSLVRAAQVAEESLKAMNLGPEYYLRSITFVAGRESAHGPIYEARFEPPAISRAKVGDDAPAAKYRVIAVNMEGKATIEDRESPASRIIRRKSGEAPQPATPDERNEK